MDEADELLREFVSEMPKFYGKTSQVMNIHNLQHIAEDAKTMEGPLSLYSAFPFENHLRKIKPLARSGVNVVSQVFRRMSEIERAGTATMFPYPEISKAEKKMPSSNFHSSIQMKNFKIDTPCPDNLVQLNDG